MKQAQRAASDGPGRDTRDDPRWLEWLRITRGAAEGPDAERVQRLDDARRAREELKVSFERTPPRPPTPDVARQLQEVESALAELARRAQSQLAAALEELRRVRAGARGYRPEPTSAPSLVSRNV